MTILITFFAVVMKYVIRRHLSLSLYHHVYLLIPNAVISSGSRIWETDSGQNNSAQPWSSFTGAAKGSWTGSSILSPGHFPCCHPEKQHFHGPTAGPGRICTGTFILELGHEGFRAQPNLIVLTVQPLVN